jgi:hypothetical protein
MTADANADKKTAAPADAPEQDPSERRRHRRVDFNAKARVLKADGVEEPCLVINASAGGALFKAVNPPAEGDRVVVYIDDVGRFEGFVIRSSKHAFAVDYRSRRAKSRRTADSLTEAVHKRAMSLDRRGTPRIRRDGPAMVTLEDGTVVECQILDISLTGASIAIAERPPLGAPLTIGKMQAKVVRRHETGVGVVFTGAAHHMEDVFAQAEAPAAPNQDGAKVAPHFGKKGV